MPDAADLERVLRTAGLRVTRPRVAVPDAVHAHPHVDTEALIVAAPCLTPSDGGGFVIDEAEVVYSGRCPSCAAGQSPAPPNRPAAERETP